MRYKIVNRKKLLATVVVDAMGRFLSFPFRIFSRHFPIETDSIRSILVIREAYLGDVVMTLPLLPPLRRRFPLAKITFLTSSAARPVLETNPYVDEVLEHNAFWFYPGTMRDYLAFRWELGQRSFDLVIEARGDIRDILLLACPPKSRHRVGYGIGGGAWMLTNVVPFREISHKVQFHLNIARVLGCECDEVEWGLYFKPEELSAARNRLLSSGIDGAFLAAHPGSRMPLKQWSAEKCASLYDRLLVETNLPLVIFGTDGEMSFVEEVADGMKGRPTILAGKLGVRQLAASFSLAKVLVCNDSAPMHLAACVGTPVVALFGPSVSSETGPYGEGHRVIEKDFPCRAGCDENTCRNGEFQACMRAIEVDEVFSAVMETLRGGSA